MGKSTDTKINDNAVALAAAAEQARLASIADSAEGGDTAAIPLTLERVEDAIDGIMQGVCTLFYEPEERVIANNGKAYPIDFDFGTYPEVDSTGELITVDKYAFLNRQLGRSMCSGLDMILRNQDQAIERQQGRIQSELRFGRNVGTDVTAKVERMADFLGAMQEQRAFVQAALHRAVEALNTQLGEEYVSKKDAEQVVASRKAAITGNVDLSAKLAKLGVKID